MNEASRLFGRTKQGFIGTKWGRDFEARYMITAQALETDTKSLGEHPPMPRLTLRVGITGHRPKPERLPPQSLGFVGGRLKQVFDAVDKALADLVEKYKDYFDGVPAVRLVSALAEGADQLAVAAKPAVWALDAVLPLPRNHYVKDFETPLVGERDSAVRTFTDLLDRAETTLELPVESVGFGGEDDETAEPLGLARQAAYVRLGGFLLRQIDVLVAVWDNKADDGRGGTGDVVRAAVAAGIPTVWINPLHDGFARMIEGLDKRGKIIAPNVDCTKASLSEAIAALVGIPEAKDDSGGQIDVDPVALRLKDYARERWPGPSRWILYDAFRRRIEGKPLRRRIVSDGAEYRLRWDPAPSEIPAVGPLRARIENMLLPRYTWAEALASAYSHRYRSAYFICYTLTALAVFFALLGIFAHEYCYGIELVRAKAFLVSIELLLIISVLWIVHRGRRERWKEKWMEYRCLAELLLNARFLAFVGEHGRAHSSGAASAVNGWVLWYLRATIREIGLPSASLDGTYQRAVLGAVDNLVVTTQRRWHSVNEATLRRMDQWLHRFGDRCFLFTTLILGTFFLVWMLRESMNAWGGDVRAEWLSHLLEESTNLLTLFAALLPAIGAAAAGVRETGDFGKVAERSAKTVEALAGLSRDIKKARHSTITLDQTGDILLTTAQVLTEDLAAWQSVYGHKRLELPA
jgi:hypothetical protein